MLFKVCFIHDIDTILVAKLIPSWVIRVMTGTYSVYIALFPQFNILQHALLCHDMSGFWVHFVAVNTTQSYLLSVYKHHAIFYFYLAEAHFCFCWFNLLSKTVCQRKAQSVEIRVLCIPLMRIGYFGFHPSIGSIATLWITLI